MGHFWPQSTGKRPHGCRFPWSGRSITKPLPKFLIGEPIQRDATPLRFFGESGGDIIVSTVRTYLRAISAITASHPNLIVSTGFAVVASSAPGQLIRFVRATSTALPWSA